MKVIVFLAIVVWVFCAAMFVFTSAKYGYTP